MNLRNLLVLFLAIGLLSGIAIQTFAQNTASAASPSVSDGVNPAFVGSVEYFLKLDGIEGESTVAAHQKEIDIMSYDWAEVQSRQTGSGMATGRVQMKDFHFVMKANKASPKLFLAVANGQHIKEAIMTISRNDGENGLQDFMKWKLTDVLVSSYQTAGNDNNIPIDEFNLSFAKIEVSYWPVNADGNLIDPVIASWDLRTNRR